MARYLFQADYRGVIATDDIGEEFATLQEAEAHAAIVANELGRNTAEAVAVSVLVMNVGVLSAKSRSAPRRSDAKDLAMLYFPGVTIPTGFAWWCRAYSLAACIILWNLLLA